ncbi:disintegrin and metalloproteinase domain-containing protein 23 isoform X1 [Protopterus annectens]|uniref:disintegrin and metalloproteinase domain-containing protein 23 isoform X1 n=1 Tax=Protopterus annectens TaxID=7888 RepID=UPI001CFB12BB|nr:disintegrin and metalloproteinase domain-containing protein 23 isoform X1 [Protopterus annectens]
MNLPRTSLRQLVASCILFSYFQTSWAALTVVRGNKTAGRDAVPEGNEDGTNSENSSTSGNSTRNAMQEEITFPSRLVYFINEDSETPYHILDTRMKNHQKLDKVVHLAQVSFQIEAFGSKFILDLSLNNDLLSSDYVEIHFENGKQVLSQGGEHCYYHGEIRRNNGSKAALSTCDGLHGMFDDGLYMYMIEPSMHLGHYREETPTRPHNIQRILRVQTQDQLSDTGSMEEDDPLSELMSEFSWLRKKRRRRKRGASMIPLRKGATRSVFEEMKYLELMIVNDHKMYKRHRSSRSHMNNFAKSVVNLVDAIFKEQLNTRVVLVAVETWSDRDRITIDNNPVKMLREFSKYRQHSIKQHADVVHLLSNVTFHYKRSSLAYFGGVCSKSRGVGVNEYGLSWTMASGLSQSLAQNLGIQWEPATKRPRECKCIESWGGCIMEETGVYHTRKFSKCSIADYKEFLNRGGGSCLFNKPTKLFENTECGNGYVEQGEECDCGLRMECISECCKKCSLANGAHCSDGPCCNVTCLFLPRGFDCRSSVNDCDIEEYCTGDSGQCPPNLHKQDGYACASNKGRCYDGMCKTRDEQCRYVWGPKASGSDKFCYEKLNTEGTEKGNCGWDGKRPTPCSKHDVFCGYLLCTNIGRVPRIGHIEGDITPTSFNHQGKVVDCSGGHVLLDDETDLGYVEDGTPCGPSMMCLERKCLPIQSLNISSCPTGTSGRVCSGHGTCTNEATCSCESTWAGTDCSIYDPIKDTSDKKDGPKVSMATNRLIGAVAGTILALGVIFGGTGWGIENVKKRRYDPSQQGPY